MTQSANICIGILLVFALFGSDASGAMPSFSKVKSAYTMSEALVLDRNREVIHELRVDDRGRRLDWVDLKAVSPSLQTAVLKSEDKRFYQHHGVDWLALGSAGIRNLFSSHQRGASTITMQLTSILDRRKAGTGRRSWHQKWQQIQNARDLERSWSKEEILEAYLNLISFRGELQGIAAASNGFFGKESHGLDDIEASILAALIRSPNAAADKVALRACALIRSIRTSIDCTLMSAKVREALAHRLAIKPRIDLAPHVATYLLEPFQQRREKKFSVVSTLNGRLQRFATDILHQQLLSIRAQNVKDGAVLVVENKTGEILAYIGSSGDLSSARFVDGVRAPRQAGSTLKPFLYGLAFDERVLTPASLLDDSATDISVQRGIYRPRNYDDRFHGPVAVRTALASSLNVPAVRALTLVGTEAFLRKLRDLGFTSLNEDDEFYGPSLALGSADVSLWALVNAYRSIANGGQWSELKLTAEQNSNFRRVFSEEASFLISSILSDRESRSLTFGLEGPLATRFWTAVKTGTSKEMRDNWCIGYSSKYTVGVWVGNFTGEPMRNVSGMSGAAPVWLEIMNYLHKHEPSEPRKAPKGISQKVVDDSLLVTKRAEWFIQGTEPIARPPVLPQLHHRIVYPVDGTVLAVDPDIPEGLQKIFFEAKPRDSRIKWVLNETSMGQVNSNVSWKPQPGKHTLAIVDADNRVLDQISFFVRGRGEKEED